MPAIATCRRRLVNDRRRTVTFLHLIAWIVMAWMAQILAVGPRLTTGQELREAAARDAPARPALDHEAIEKRRREQERLERYLRQHADDQETRLELARVMASRRFLHEALKQLDTVLRADSTRVDAWRLRAAWYRELGMVRGEPALLERALDSYRLMRRFGSADDGRPERSAESETARYLQSDLIAAAGLALVLDQSAWAESFASELQLEGRDAVIARLLLALADYRAGRLERAALAIDALRARSSGPLIDALHGLDLIGTPGAAVESVAVPAAAATPAATPQSAATGAQTGDPTAAGPAVDQAAHSLGRLELARPGLAGPAQPPDRLGRQAVRLAGFWKSQDPTPTTPLNERYLEHCYRVVVADALFSREGLAGHDSDRGRVWIRYGRPDDQSITGASMSTDYEKRYRRNEAGMDEHYFDDSERPAFGDPGMHLEFPKVAWQYQVGQEIMAFEFEDLTLQGDFYFTNTSTVHSRAYAKQLPTLYERAVPGGTVKVAQTETRFRGIRSDVLFSIATAVPAVRVTGRRDTTRSSWEDVEVRWAVFDRAYRTVAEDAMRLDDPHCVYRDPADREFLLARADFDLPAGSYVMATEFRDHRTGKEGIVKRAITVEPIEGLLSEIELCRAVERVAAGSTRPFVRYDAQVVPNPRNEVASGDRLRFYYEIYGLGRTADGRRRCRIQHRVRSLKEPRNARPTFPLAYSIEIDEPVGKYDSYMPRVGQLDVSTLRVGRYELQVEVEDLVTGATAQRAVGFLRRP